MPKIINQIYFLLLFFSSASLATQYDYQFQKSFKIQRLSIEQGLSQSVVYDTIQDSQGYIWVATEDGLNRFNGYDFEVFQHKHSDDDSLHENLIFTLLEEPNEGIWIGTQNGLSFYDQSTQKFINYSEIQTTKLASVVSLIQANNNNLFIASDNGLFVLDNKSKQIDLFVSATGEKILDPIIGLDKSDSHIWLITNSCFYSIDQTSFELKNYCDTNSNVLDNVRALKVVKYNQAHLWLGTSDGLIDFDLVSEQFSHLKHDENDDNSLSSNFIQDLAFAQTGEIWIGTSEGADRYTFSNSKILHFKSTIFASDGLSSSEIMSIFIDKSGLVWLGTYAGGLNIIDPFQTQFNHLLTKSDLAAFNVSNAIHGITQDDRGNLWVANFGGGLFKINSITGKTSRPFHDEMLALNENSNYAYSLLFDLNKQLWVGTANGLSIIDLKQNKLLKVKVVIDGKTARFDEYIFKIYEDHDGKIWIGAMNGLYYLEKSLVSSSSMVAADKNKSLQAMDEISIFLVDKTPNLPTTYLERNSSVNTMLETKDGNLWVGGPSGLLMYSRNNENWTHFQYHKHNPQSLTYNEVQVIYEDSRGILWIGTANGLNKVNRISDDEVYFERITKENGLTNNVIYGILEDLNKQLWLSTNLGLIRYSENPEKIQSFFTSDGISSNEFNSNAAYSNSDGLLVFGSINGLTMVDSLTQNRFTHKKNLKFTSLKVGSELININQLNNSELPVIVQQVEDEIIDISFADLYYKKLAAPIYRYRLINSGQESEWINLNKERRVIFSRLAEADYLLEIQSKVADEKWSHQSLKLKIIAHGDFWRSAKAYYALIFLFFVLLSLSTYLIVKHYKQRLNKLNKQFDLNSIYMKEARQDNVELKKELGHKLNEMNLMQNEILKFSNLLESQKFREPTTGLYKFDAVERIFNNSLGENSVEVVSIIALIKITDYKKIINEYGDICATELRLFIASELKLAVTSNSHITYLNDDEFLVFANVLNNQEFISYLADFRNKIRRSQITIANGLSIKTKIGLTYLDISPQKISHTGLIIQLSKILMHCHQQYNPKKLSSLMNIVLNAPIDSYLEIDTDKPSEIESLVTQSNKITMHFL